MNFSKWTPPDQEPKKKHPVGKCACGNATANTNRKGEFFCLVCDVDAKRAAAKANGQEPETFTPMRCLGAQYPTL